MRMILASKPRNSAVAAVDFLRIDTVQLAHPGGEIGFWSFDDHVVVIAHPAPGMDRPVEAFAALGQSLQPRQAVGGINVDVLAPVPALGDVVKTAGEF
jgi:hypothetical protein